MLGDPQRGLPERLVSVLRAWLFEHFLHPFKQADARKTQTGLTRSQVSNWFINARVRLWKPMVKEMYMEEIKEHEQNGSEDKTSQQSPSVSQSRDYNVKLSIKSFKVPELVIEIHATATTGSLKRTVMEAVTAILGDGLHVGILLQGKTIRDDNKTLLQTGNFHDDKHHCLVFMLEPKHVQIMPPTCTEDCPLLSNGTPHSLMHALPLTLQPGPSDISPLPQVMNPGSCVDNNLDVARSPVDISSDNAMPTSRALVAVPAIAIEALAVVPFNRKSPMQRQIRRPFSVSEVKAVEKLGSGRWRDVKLRAFDNAKHRTYVDLKDKWKTLVHTARISPQQRRGAPVPQQLLDRVLAAHSY